MSKPDNLLDPKLRRRLKQHFEAEVLPHTCFDSLDHLLRDKTLVDVNAPRAMIAVNLLGVWRGMQIAAHLLTVK